MTQLRRFPALLLAVILALAVGVGPAPVPLLAAPAIQETGPEIVGFYQSDVLPGDGESPDLVVGLILYEDGSAEVLSEYDNEQDVIIEVGTWVENGDGTLTLTVTGTTDGDYAAPIELDFEMDEDGSLVVPGAEDGAFGEEGLILFPSELGNDILAELPDDAIVYQSEVMPSASSPGLQLTLAIFDDGSLTLVSDYMNPGEIVVEIGTWSEADDGSLVVTLTGQVENGEGTITEFEEPLDFVFTVNDDNSLSLVDEGGALFGDEGLTLAPVDPDATVAALTGDDVTGDDAPATEEGEEAAEEEGAAEPETGEATDEGALDETQTITITPSGPYVSDVLPSEDESGTFLVSIFYDDGSVLITTYNLNGELPIVEEGSWADSGDGAYLITVTGTVDEAYDEPVEVEFIMDEDGVIFISNVPLYPLENIDLSVAPSLAAEFQSDVITDTIDLTHTITLFLYDDFSLEMVTDYVENGESYVEYGEWDINDENQVVVTLTGDDEIEYDQPVEWVFDIGEDGAATLANDDEAYYGEAGLILLPVVVEDELVGEGTAGEAEVTDGEEITGSVEITSGVEITGGEEITAGVEITDEEASTVSDDIATAENIQVFQSDVLPVATGPGLQLTLGLLDDGSAAIDYDYLDGAEIVTNLGEWVDNEDGTITITFTEGPAGTLEAPVELTLELGNDGNLTITDASEESLGLLDVVLAPIALE